MAKKLNLTYIDKNGADVHPAILHRGLTGSIERTIGILIEHFAGNFPTWLTPVQVKVLPITEKHIKYAAGVVKKLKDVNIRVELDDRNETLQAKIRDGQIEKVSYMLIVGDKEVKDKTVTEQMKLIQELDEEDKKTIFRLIEKMLTNKKFKDFFNKNIAAL